MLAALESLPEDEREVFTLVCVQGMTHAEAATVLREESAPLPQQQHV